MAGHGHPDGPLDFRRSVGAVTDEHDCHPSSNRLAQSGNEMGQRNELVGHRIHQHGQEIRGGNDRHR